MRPISPFIAFCHAHRDKVKAANPNAAFGETGRVLTQLWKELSESEKAAYRNPVHGGVFMIMEETHSVPPPHKKPLPAFLAFCRAKRDQVYVDNPRAKLGEIDRILYDLWKDLRANEKEAYRKSVEDGTGLRRSTRLKNRILGKKLP
ncbi:MAG: hypothetical protein EBU93_03210 [Chlamydiae bacterium]|nr:hypothetical protein [Chlamydiota bacterium]